MKSLILSLLFIVMFAAISFAKPKPVKKENVRSSYVESQSTMQTRELVNALNLNEVDYIRIKNLARLKFQEIEKVLTGKETSAPEITASLTKIDEEFDNAVRQLLTTDQIKTFASLKEIK